jgi:hypothetical protein
VANESTSGHAAKLQDRVNSSRDSKRRTEAEIQAIMRAHIIDGHIVSNVWRMAMAGELGVPAFDPGRRYIYSLIKNNRDSFEAQNPDALQASTTKALALAHKANLDALRALAKDTDPQERARIAKAVSDSAKTLNAVAQKPARENTNAQPATPDAKQDPTLSSLIALAPKTSAQSQKSGSLTRANNDTDPSTRAA